MPDTSVAIGVTTGRVIRRATRLLARTAIGVLAAGIVSACARYRPAPLAPAAMADAFQTRSLTDPRLAAYVEAQLASPADDRAGSPMGAPSTEAREPWDLRRLTAAAWYLHPDLDVARAGWAIARAQAITAGARPLASVDVTPAFNTNTPEDESPWLLTNGFDLVIETAGKRRHRAAEASHIAEAARLDVAAASWAVYARLRGALGELQVAARDSVLLADDEARHLELVDLLEVQLAVGDIDRLVVDVERLALQRTRIDAAAGAVRVSVARHTLAASLAVPAAALDAVSVVALRDSLPDSDLARETLPSAVAAAALRDRVDIRRGIATYAAADAGLRLAVANQYPDLRLGPAVRWASDQQRWSLRTGLTALGARRGPVAEAAARRDEEGARFLALQVQVLSGAEQAVATFRLAHRRAAAAAAAVRQAEARIADVRELFAVRDVDTTAVLRARREVILAHRARIEAFSDVLTSAGALEDAMQRPLDLGIRPPSPTVVSPRTDPAAMDTRRRTRRERSRLNDAATTAGAAPAVPLLDTAR